MLRVLAIVLLLVVFIAGAALSYFNYSYVSFNYLFGSTEVRLVVLIVLTFVVASVLTLLLCAVRLFSLSGETRRLRRQLRDAETELKNLRNLPISTER
ncbi:MAG TPA: LapA family protein [Nevskia sp.]|nr:LapA family protein [Nevskia sp.]